MFKKIIFCAVLLSHCFLFSTQVWALEGESHRVLNEFIVRQADAFQLDFGPFLVDELGLPDGVTTQLKNGSKTISVVEWIGEGGAEEDSPFTRSFKHFHDPTRNLEDAGLGGMMLSALRWAQQPPGTQLSGGSYSWHDARQYYLNALTATSIEQRDENLAKMFRAIGQVMHLLEDMSVPEHVRDDPHPSNSLIGWLPIYSSYEKYVNLNIATEANIDAFFQTTYSNMKRYEWDALLESSAFSASDARVPIANLFDKHSVSGLFGLPGDLTSGLSEYTNTNYFSDDTIFKEKYEYPRKEDLEIIAAVPTTIPNAVNERRYYRVKSTAGVEKVERMAVIGRYYDYMTKNHPNEQTEPRFYLDDDCYQEYAQHLIPRAMGYAASVPDYFFRGRFEVRSTPFFSENHLQSIILKIKNVSKSQEDLLDGTYTFSISFPNEGGPQKVMVPLISFSIQSLPYDEEVEVATDLPAMNPDYAIAVSDYDNVLGIISGAGALGNEEGAVVGRVFKLVNDFPFNEEWDQSPNGSHAWQHLTQEDPNRPGNGNVYNTVVTGPNPTDPTFLIKENCRFEGADYHQWNSTWLTAEALEGGIGLTENTYMQLKIDNVTSNLPEDDHSQGVFLSITAGGTDINLFIHQPGQGYFNNPGAGPTMKWSYDFNSGPILVNFHELFAANNLPVPTRVNSIEFWQQIVYYAGQAAPEEQVQHMEVDYIRFVEEVEDNP